MRISLGSGVTNDSRHTLYMILFVQSFYFLSLGLCLVMYDQQLQQQGTFSPSSSASSPPPPPASPSSSPSPPAQQSDTKSPPPPPKEIKTDDVLSLHFLFCGGLFPNHPHHAVLLVFLLHGLLLGSCVGALVERRTWCFDVVLTAEVIFFIATLFVAGLTGVGWRLVCLTIDSLCAVGVALFVAGKREQQEVSWGTPTTMVPTPTYQS